jgi:hypothetical protein
MYEEAVDYVTAYLKDPPQDAPSDVRLHFLQSLIIELGLLNIPGVELPTSCKAAKALLKTHVHINIRDYLQGRTRIPAGAPAPAAPLNKSQKKLKKKGKAPAQVPVTKEVGVGVQELQKLMYPSKAALQRSLFTNQAGKKPRSKRVSMKWVKRRGLEVFLVSCFN